MSDGKYFFIGIFGLIMRVLAGLLVVPCLILGVIFMALVQCGKDAANDWSRP